MQGINMAMGRPPLMQLDCVEHISAVSDHDFDIVNLRCHKAFEVCLQKNSMIRAVSMLKSKNKKTTASTGEWVAFTILRLIIMENSPKFKDSSLFPSMPTFPHHDKELVERLISENQQLRQLACPLSDDCLCVDDWLQKDYAKNRGL